MNKIKRRKIMFPKTIVQISILTIIIGAVFLANGLILAWTGPTDPPPDGNVEAPINVSLSSQYKEGALGIGGVFRGYSNAIFDGNVGIGVTNPEAKLDILREDTAAYVRIFNVGTYWSENALTVMNNGNVGIGTADPEVELDVNGKVKAAAFLYSSDASLKENIQAIPGALEKILNLDGIKFNWKEGGESSIGLIAQDVEKVFPELVTTDSLGLKSLQYGNLVAPLIEAIKEQQKQIEELKLEVERLQK
jgi:hypothetical protein